MGDFFVNGGATVLDQQLAPDIEGQITQTRTVIVQFSRGLTDLVALFKPLPKARERNISSHDTSWQ